jgi:O-antigen ligase
MKIVLDLLLFLGVTLSSGALLDLVRQGGVVDQGLDAKLSAGSPLLDSLPRMWGVLVLFAFALYIYKRRAFSPSRVPLKGLILLSAVSAAWSAFPVEAVRQTLLMSALIALAYTHGQSYGVVATLRTVAATCTFWLLASLLLIAFLPELGVSVGAHSGAWQGVFDHKNGLGLFGALSCVVFVWLRQYRQGYRVQIILASILVLGSGSTTATIVTIVALSMGAMSQSALLRSLLQRWIGVIIVATCASVIGAGYLLMLEQSWLGDAELTGRILIWRRVISDASEHYILGQGAGQFLLHNLIGGGGDLYGEVGFILGSTHSGYLETFYSLGLVGVVLMIYSFISCLKGGGTRGALTHALPVLSIMLLNIAESKFLGFHLTILLLAIVAQQSGRAGRGLGC